MTAPALPGTPVHINPDFCERSLFRALLDARRGHGRKTWCLEDQDRKPLSYDRLVIGALVLGNKLRHIAGPRERIGILLPNSLGVAIAFFAAQAYGRVPAMLNFSAGILNMDVCCRAAQISVIVTSRRFVEKAGLQSAIDALAQIARIVYLEDVRAEISTAERLWGLAAGKMARTAMLDTHSRPDDIAVVLFTSGTEGVPKGVALTHRNVLANCAQFLAIAGLTSADRFFNALPVFHSFGLTAAFLGPLVAGMAVMLYPSPLHFKQIPPLIQSFEASVVVSTDTFAMGWGRAATAEDFASVRLMVLGAERVRDKTRSFYRDKFDLDLFEGYGATEASPVIAVNVPGAAREDTVGRLLPDIDYRLEAVPGLDEGGRLQVRGPNIMAGYMTIDAPGTLVPPADGWHDTGDIVAIDGEGYVSIKGRAKRFAKIGGEMVSLAAVEAYAASVWPHNSHAAAVVASPRKGEEIVLVTDCQDADISDLLAWTRAHGVGDIMVPKRIAKVDAVPVLGTGKLDLQGVNAIAASALVSGEQA